MTNPTPTGTLDLLDLLDHLVRRARAAGADAADAMAVDTVSQSAASRFGALERVNRAESARLGLRILIGRRQAVVSATDHGAETLAALVERAVAMARQVPEDPFCGLAEPETLAAGWPDLDLLDPVEPDAATLAERARAAEAAALAVPGVVNSRVVEAGWSRSAIALVTSGGFKGRYETSRHSLYALMLAAGEGEGGGQGGLERDYEHDARTHAGDLRDPAAVGRQAGERAVRRLGARKVASCKVPVVFEARVAASLLDHFVGAASGPAVARGTSFLKDRMGAAILPAAVTIRDDPHRRRGLRSRPFDAEGAATRPLSLVEAGRLASWLLDARSARQLGRPATGHAARGAGGLPSPAPANLTLDPGTASPTALIGAIADGFYVTELMGMGVNLVTGDYSRGASGFWIEQGVLTHPVNEVTIAGNLADMLRTLEAADDLDPHSGLDSPTVRIDGMTVAGR